jgi:hypothetical protein
LFSQQQQSAQTMQPATPRAYSSSNNSMSTSLGGYDGLPPYFRAGVSSAGHHSNMYSGASPYLPHPYQATPNSILHGGYDMNMGMGTGVFDTPIKQTMNKNTNANANGTGSAYATPPATRNNSTATSFSSMSSRSHSTSFAGSTQPQPVAGPATTPPSTTATQSPSGLPDWSNAAWMTMPMSSMGFMDTASGIGSGMGMGMEMEFPADEKLFGGGLGGFDFGDYLQRGDGDDA